MTNKEIWEHFEHLEDEIDELCKDVDMDKVYDDICKKNGITREQWEKMEEWQKISLIAPKGLWHEEEDEEIEE
jgi:hypothetical protein